MTRSERWIRMEKCFLQALFGKMEVINMSSILVGELKDILEDVPEDYEVIMEITTGCDTKAGTSIAYINGVKRDEEFKEIMIMN